MKRLFAPALAACVGAVAPLSAAAATGTMRAQGVETATCALQPSGLTTHRIRSGGIERSYVLLVPPGYDGTGAAPVVIDFHGKGYSRHRAEVSPNLERFSGGVATHSDTTSEVARRQTMAMKHLALLNFEWVKRHAG